MSAVEPSPWWSAEELDGDRWGALVAPIIERVTAARSRQRMPQSLLLVGPPHLGRELAAVELAALLTCPDHGSWGCTCASCRRARSGKHPDVTLVRAQGKKEQITIDQVREIVEAVPGRPFEGASRVWILEGVQAGRFGREAANAFLKTLEEPPRHVHFLLLTENPEAVLPTIRSRCQRLNLPGAGVLADRLGDLEVPVELASAAAGGAPVSEQLAAVRKGFESGLRGEVIDLIRAARRLEPEAAAFQIAAAVALEMAAEGPESDEGQDMALLAADLLRWERRQRALNLNRGRLLLSCFLTWYDARTGASPS